MAKPKKKYEKPLHLDMPFDEALRRYAQTDPRELPEKNKRKAKKKQTKRLASEQTAVVAPRSS